MEDAGARAQALGSAIYRTNSKAPSCRLSADPVSRLHCGRPARRTGTPRHRCGNAHDAARGACIHRRSGGTFPRRARTPPRRWIRRSLPAAPQQVRPCSISPRSPNSCGYIGAGHRPIPRRDTHWRGLRRSERNRSKLPRHTGHARRRRCDPQDARLTWLPNSSRACPPALAAFMAAAARQMRGWSPL